MSKESSIKEKLDFLSACGFIERYEIHHPDEEGRQLVTAITSPPFTFSASALASFFSQFLDVEVYDLEITGDIVVILMYMYDGGEEGVSVGREVPTKHTG